MTVTPQTNATLEEIAESLLKHESFCICGHINPDGDCIGSTLALAGALRMIGKTVYALVADDGELDPSFSFMPGVDTLINASQFDSLYDVFIAVDAPNEERMGETACEIRGEAILTVTLDHHAAPARMSDLSYTDPDSASASLIIWQLAKYLGIAIGAEARDIAVCAYSGLLTDTGRFMFQNTNPEAFRLASEMVACGIDVSEIARRLFQEKSIASVRMDALAVERMKEIADGRAVLSWLELKDLEDLGAVKADAENAINAIRQIRGVEVACVLKERQDVVRGSLRAKGDIDVSALARELGGGGHKAAAGFTLDCSLEEAREIMRAKLASLFS